MRLFSAIGKARAIAPGARRRALVSLPHRAPASWPAHGDFQGRFHGKAGNFKPADVGNLSTSQFVAALAPGARVVKALNTMSVPNLEADPIVNGARRVAFISADDHGAKKRVETLLESFGYSIIDLGNLRDGGLIQQAGGPLAGRNLLEQGERHK